MDNRSLEVMCEFYEEYKQNVADGEEESGQAA